ncbi:aminotransferase class I/II-fold pyridoxal phosphate-dependent enzyme [Streptomyces sp. M19]
MSAGMARAVHSPRRSARLAAGPATGVDRLPQRGDEPLPGRDLLRAGRAHPGCWRTSTRGGTSTGIWPTSSRTGAWTGTGRTGRCWSTGRAGADQRHRGAGTAPRPRHGRDGRGAGDHRRGAGGHAAGAARAVRLPTDVLAVATPCFVGITGAARLLDIEVTGIEEGAAGIDLDALAERCASARRAGRRVRACYVAPDFANPGGSRMPLERRRRLLELAEREDFWVLEDNAYGFTAAVGEELPPLKAIDPDRRVVHIGTFAKVCFPGARVGYVVADQRVGGADGGTLLADELAALKSMVTVNTSPLSQAVIGGMLLDHGVPCSNSAAPRPRCTSATWLSSATRWTGIWRTGSRRASTGTGPRAGSSSACGCRSPPTPRCWRPPRRRTGCCGPHGAVPPRRRGRPAAAAVVQLSRPRPDRDRSTSTRRVPEE